MFLCVSDRISMTCDTNCFNDKCFLFCFFFTLLQLIHAGEGVDGEKDQMLASQVGFTACQHILIPNERTLCGQS